MKRLISLIFVFVMIFTSTVIPAFADSEGPVFGGGFSNVNSKDGKVVAAATILSAYYGIPIGPLLPDESYSYGATILTKMMECNNGIYEFLDENTEIDTTGARTKISFLNDFFVREASGGTIPGMPTKLYEFYEYLFGTNTMNGDPFESIVQSPDRIKVDNKLVIPWHCNKNALNLYQQQNFGVFTTKGQFVIPGDGGTYHDFWQNGYNNSLTSDPHTVETQTTQGSTPISQSANIGTLNFRSVTNATYGPVRDIILKGQGNSPYGYSIWYHAYEGGQASAFAYIPAISNDGYFCWVVYSYVYEGSFIPSTWNNRNYSLVPITYSFKPRIYDPVNLEFSSDGVDISKVAVNNELYVYGDTYEDIVNNYISGDTVIYNNYTDPSSWDTSQGGHATPDGNGGFNFDLDGFHLPDLNIDWKIEGLKNKFPFSIPWDIIKFFSILNVEPEAPHIEGEIDLKITTWEIDFDFSQFDDTALLFRNLFYISFVIGLIFYTKDFLKR